MEMHLVSLFLMENEEFSISLMTLLRAESTNTCAAGDCYLPSTLSLQLQFLAELGSLVDFQSSPLSASFGWRPPVWPTTDLWEAHTWVPQLVKAVVASNQPPESLSSGTWQHLLCFPQEHLALKFHPRGHWSCPFRNLLPCSTHVLRQHQDPGGHLIGVR